MLTTKAALTIRHPGVPGEEPSEEKRDVNHSVKAGGIIKKKERAHLKGLNHGSKLITLPYLTQEVAAPGECDGFPFKEAPGSLANSHF